MVAFSPSRLRPDNRFPSSQSKFLQSPGQWGRANFEVEHWAIAISCVRFLLVCFQVPFCVCVPQCFCCWIFIFLFNSVANKYVILCVVHYLKCVTGATWHPVLVVGYCLNVTANHANACLHGLKTPMATIVETQCATAKDLQAQKVT